MEIVSAGSRDTTRFVRELLQIRIDNLDDFWLAAERSAALMGDAAFLRDQLAAPKARLHEARAMLAALKEMERGARQRSRMRVPGYFHSGPLDPWPLLLSWTIQYVHEAGFYEPSELEQMLDAGEISLVWMGAEALRLQAFLVMLHALIDLAWRGGVMVGNYVGLVRQLAQRFSRVRLTYS